jgi:peptidoglycan/LPS O-acetylase OafA/YrhL
MDVLSTPGPQSSTDQAAEASQSEVTTGSNVPTSGRFRADIEGMRAIAILVIVAYHAGIPGFSGGFIGVDVFFVISGYLITRNLLDESSSSGRVSLFAFWARRIRRLVPGLALMVIVTLVASSLIFAPFDMLEIAKEGAASALYVSNLVFASNSQNYFASNINKSPFLHTWSLGVEEQFYLVWPFLVCGALIIARRSEHLVRRVVVPIFLIVLVASFALNVRWTGEGSTWAFFSLPTRAWEFAAGGLLAAIVVEWTSRRWSLLCGAVGLLLLVYATVWFTDATEYPGVNASVPVVGASLLIFSGRIVAQSEPTPVMAALSVGPMRWIGRLSYSWYLWHWPFIVLAVLSFNNDSTWLRTLAACASLGAAYLAFTVVENPIRLSQRLRRSSGRTYVVGVVITLAVLGAAEGTWLAASRSTPTSFTQAKNAAFKDFFPICATRSTAGGMKYCAGGDLASPTVVVLVGDSHAGTWFNALSQVASRQGVRLAGYFEPGCPFIPVVVRPLPNGPIDTSRCLALRKQGMQLLAELKPKVVVLTQHEGQYLGLIMDASGSVPATEVQVQLWKSAFGQFLDQMMAEGIQPAVILDDPTLPYQPAECISRTGSIAACEPTRQASLSTARPLIDAERSVLAKHPSVPVFAPDSVLCNRAGCPLELDNHLLYADTNHLLFGATRLMEPEVSELLKSALAAKS